MVNSEIQIFHGQKSYGSAGGPGYNESCGAGLQVETPACTYVYMCVSVWIDRYRYRHM